MYLKLLFGAHWPWTWAHYIAAAKPLFLILQACLQPYTHLQMQYNNFVLGKIIYNFNVRIFSVTDRHLV